MSTVSGKESISRSLHAALAALERGDQEESESQLAALLGDVRRLSKPIHNPPRGTPGRATGFAGDQFGLDHEAVKLVETGINQAQTYVRGRDLKGGAVVIQRVFDGWTG